jgi:hypothetical protein
MSIQNPIRPTKHKERRPSVITIQKNQWHAALFVALDPPNKRYPKNAPKPTASMIQPLYVMNRSLCGPVSLPRRGHVD